jgi:D-glycero-D-manno-heptose 1,7-bisphosphate phosphatase
MSRPAVFLDQCGTLIREPDYPVDPNTIELQPTVPRALHALKGAGFHLVVVTNQSGIARGLFSLEEYKAVAARVDALMAGAGVRPDRVEFCPHHPGYTGPCDCRKPGTGMHRRAAAYLKVDLARTWCVGDQVKDLLPAQALGMEGAVLVRTGHGDRNAPAAPAWARVAPDLGGAVEIILQGPPP